MTRKVTILKALCLLLLPTLSNATDVGGIISTDTTWNLAGSPYNIISNVQVSQGVTLTIEPGVVVNRSENAATMELWGSIQAIGTSTSRISFNGVTLIRQDASISMRIDFADFSTHTEFNGWCQIYGAQLILRDSILRDGSQIYLRNGDSYVERNIFHNSELIVQNSDLNLIRNNLFYHDRFVWQSILVDSYCSNPLIAFNSFLNTDLIAIRLGYGDKGCIVTANNNFWNTEDASVIDSIIWDKNDDLTISGLVLYTPFLTKSHPDTPFFQQNQDPTANAGDDKVVFNEVTLDASNSSDPDGTIVSYEWTLQHREEPACNRTAEGVNTIVSGLEPGFYDVMLTVTDNNGAIGKDMMLLAVAGQCTGWPNPNALLSTERFKIVQNERSGIARTTILGYATLPEIILGNTVHSRITIELFHVLDGGGDCVFSEEMTLPVKERGKRLVIGE